MPKNTVTDPITGQEIAFALLVLSGTMNDRQAAEAAGLNPDTAAYTKSKPRVRDYMIEHRNAVREKLVEKEVDGLRQLNLGRDQILARLWELANLSHEVTRGSIAGQIKAVSLIIAMEGLIPGRGATQPAAPPIKAEIYTPEWLGKQQHQPVSPQATDDGPGDPVSGTKTPPEPAAEWTKDTSSPHLDHPQPSPINPFINPPKLSRVPAATDVTFDTVLDTNTSLRLPFSIQKGRFGKRR
jgi:hypothetical protein